MNYVTRPWLAVVPWSQVLLSSGAIATVLPHWPPHQRRMMLPGRAPVVFEPAPMAMVTVCEPDDVEALAAIAAVFGKPDVLAELDGKTGQWWRCPPAVAATVDAHLRDWHRNLDPGATSHLTRNVNDALQYHWQLHQQVLVHPLPSLHFHA